MKIGFAGLGNMGSAMARNLIAAGHELTVWNRSADKAEPLKAEGARIATDPAGVAYGCDAVFTMLADDAAVEAVIMGSHGIAQAMAPSSCHVSCSTISTAIARRLSAAHEKLGQQYVSAPVFGRPEAAAAKKLLVVAAGDRRTIARVDPLLGAIGRRTIVAGAEPWQANLVKICGNFTIAGAIEAMGEAFATIRKSGVDPETFLRAIAELYESPVYRGYGQAIAGGRFSPAGFALRLGLKDVRLMLEAAEEWEAPMPLASLVRDRFLSALAHGQEDMDWSSIALVSARDAGL